MPSQLNMIKRPTQCPGNWELAMTVLESINMPYKGRIPSEGGIARLESNGKAKSQNNHSVMRKFSYFLIAWIFNNVMLEHCLTSLPRNHLVLENGTLFDLPLIMIRAKKKPKQHSAVIMDKIQWILICPIEKITPNVMVSLSNCTLISFYLI